MRGRVTWLATPTSNYGNWYCIATYSSKHPCHLRGGSMVMNHQWWLIQASCNWRKPHTGVNFTKSKLKYAKKTNTDQLVYLALYKRTTAQWEVLCWVGVNIRCTGTLLKGPTHLNRTFLKDSRMLEGGDCSTLTWAASSLYWCTMTVSVLSSLYQWTMLPHLLPRLSIGDEFTCE